MKEHFYIRIAQFGYSRSGGFTIEELKTSAPWSIEEEKIIDKHIKNAYTSGQPVPHEMTYHPELDSMFSLMDTGMSGTETFKFILRFDFFFNYLDYLELQEVKKNSKQAMCTAIIAIGFSFLAIVVQIITSIYSSEIKALIQNIN